LCGWLRTCEAALLARDSAVAGRCSAAHSSRPPRVYTTCARVCARMLGLHGGAPWGVQQCGGVSTSSRMRMPAACVTAACGQHGAPALQAAVPRPGATKRWRAAMKLCTAQRLTLQGPPPSSSSLKGSCEVASWSMRASTCCLVASGSDKLRSRSAAAGEAIGAALHWHQQMAVEGEGLQKASCCIKHARRICVAWMIMGWPCPSHHL
jgi:hypothetical protein